MEHNFEDAKRPYAHLRKSSLNVRTPSATFEPPRRRGSTIVDDSVSNAAKFSAVALTNVPNQRPFVFISVSTVLRAHIPLAWLSSSSHRSPQPGTLLRAEVPGISKWEYQILIARLCSDNCLYAFERVEVDIYLCHPLHQWIKSLWIEQAAIGAAPLVNLDLLLKSQSENSHTRKHSTASVTSANDFSQAVTSPKISQTRKGQLARLSILDSRSRMEGVRDSADVQDDESNPAQFNDEARIDTPETGTNPTQFEPAPFSLAQPTCQTPLALTFDGQAILEVGQDKPADAVDHLSTEHLRRQYLETLYWSKTSLAFYSKGPLSRARARARDPNTSRSSEGLAEFYLDSILSTKKLDLKYRESIETEIARLALIDGDVVSRQTQTSRKKKQVKLGKNGLWPMEVEYIERWWKSQDIVSASLRTTERFAEEKKRSIAQLRMRETEMQILLILEVLALEARDIPTQPPNSDPTWSDVKVESIERNGSSIPFDIPTTKKKRDLKSELDILVDRLCIWHSIGAEDAVGPQDESTNPSVPLDQLKDRLRDFCKDVVVPFYGSKLPDECHTICIKMGGPELSPRRSKKVARKESTRLEPGSALVQERPTKKRDLHRVLSEDQNSRQFSPPVISRSATLPASVSGKREPSERPMSRSSIHKSVSFSNREVDLVADARVTAAKRRKLDLVAAQKRELDAAIETLKKPNRSAVARGIVDEAERRNVDHRAGPKKIEPIQITATPRRGAARQVRTDDYDLPTLPASIASQEETFVPSSTSKPRGLIHTITSVSRSSAKKRAVLSAIHDTPSRATSDRAKSWLTLEGSRPDDLVVQDGESSSTLVASTPATSRVRLDGVAESVAVTPMRMSRSLRPVLLTPLKRTEVKIEDVFKDAPEIPERAGKIMDRVMGSQTDPAGMSLYDSLGWTDDYEL